MKKLSKTNRSGLAVMEAALILPILFLLILGTTDICNRIFLKQSLSIVAYEGARIAIIPDSTTDDIVLQVEEVAAERGISDPTVTIQPADLNRCQLGPSSKSVSPLRLAMYVGLTFSHPQK